MADQEFLASFGVDVDESGVSRLQQILTENKTLAERLGASFDAASESVKAFKEQVSMCRQPSRADSKDIYPGQEKT